MNDKKFYKNIATISEYALKSAKYQALDVGLLNETLIELDRRAKKVGLKYKDLYLERANLSKEGGEKK